MTRKEAIAVGAKTYNSKKPCLRGHSAPRWTRNGECTECEASLRKEKDAHYWLRHKDRLAPRRAEYHRKWYESNKAKAHQKSYNYMKKIRQATPSWADMDLIARFYKERPEGCHVDHIVPLQGRNVCGLHVINNLQYLTAPANLSKGNRY